MWPYPWTHVGTPSHLGHMDRVAATMPSQVPAGAAQEAPDIGQWEGQDVPLVRPSSCSVKGGIPSSRRYLPTYLDTVDSQDATQPAKMATPSQRPPTTSASSSPSTSSTLSNPSPPYPAITSVAMNVHGPQPTFTASPASARPPPMAAHVAPSPSGFSSSGQVPPMLNVNDMAAQRLRCELQQVNADIQQYTQHATFAVLSPQQLQHWNGLVERSVLLHAQLQNMGSG